MAFFDPETGDDITTTAGQMAEAAPMAVHSKAACKRPSCLKAAGGYGSRAFHAAGFIHAFKPGGPAPTQRTRARSKAMARKIATHTAKANSRPLYPAGILVAQVGRLTVYSKAPWAWTKDRSGFPKSAGRDTAE